MSNENVHAVEKTTSRATRVSVIDYGPDSIEFREIENLDELSAYKSRPTVTWISVEGLGDPERIERIGEIFGLHHLVIEDVLHTDQRSKVDILGEYLFFVMKLVSFDRALRSVDVSQVSLVLGNRFVITFVEAGGRIFESVRGRLRAARGSSRKMGADYLAYALMDSMVDSYFDTLEAVGEEIEDIEDQLILDPGPEQLQRIYVLKREMIHVRKSVWPLRDIISTLERADSDLVGASIHIYLRDLYDHSVQLIDTVETQRDMLSGMLEIYVSSLSNKLNEIMKFLTIIGTIFIPLTFITGIYGMNFSNMPELRWKAGYFGALILMAVVAISLLLYFKRKKWL